MTSLNYMNAKLYFGNYQTTTSTAKLTYDNNIVKYNISYALMFTTQFDKLPGFKSLFHK